MIGARDFFRERHLRGDDFLRRLRIERRAHHQTLQLHALRARDHDDAVAQGFTTGFIQKRNVSKEKFRGLAPAFGLDRPLTPDARMQNLLERLLLFRVGEYYGAKEGAVQVPLRRINLRAEGGADLRAHLRVAVRQFTGRLVGIEKLRRGQESAQLRAEGAFAGGDSAGDSDGRHSRKG